MGQGFKASENLPPENISWQGSSKYLLNWTECLEQKESFKRHVSDLLVKSQPNLPVNFKNIIMEIRKSWHKKYSGDGEERRKSDNNTNSTILAGRPFAIFWGSYGLRSEF